jgi:hypothetical protein
MHRRNFIGQLSLATISICLSGFDAPNVFVDDESDFAKRLKPLGRALEMDGYYVWCNSPIQDDDEKIHIFFSRWIAKKGMGGWINGCEICHAVSNKPEGPYEFVDVVLAPRQGYFDATTCHNPSVKKVDDKYALFYMGNSNGKTNTKRIGLVTADSLNGPWQRTDKPLLEAGADGAWDDHCTTNPAFIKHDNGKYWLYYKSWNTKDYETGTGAIRGNRKYGLAIADTLDGPYIKYSGNPIIDFSSKGNNTQFEDAFVWREKKKFKMLARDMGIFNHENGIIMESKDGMKWSEPKIAYYAASKYMELPAAPSHLKKWGRFERPQLLFIKDKPAYLFTALQGGKYSTALAFIFKIE